MSGDLSRHYLNAMGIDSWQRRDAAQSPMQGLRQDLQIADWNTASVDASLSAVRVTIVNPDASGQLLLLLERELTSPAQDLLTAMLKAIDIDRLTQPAAIINRAATGESINVVCARIKPSIVVVMAMLTDNGNISEMDAYRQSVHRFSWLDVPVAITLHPQVLLDNPQGKRPAWEDLKRVKMILDG